MHHPRTPSRPGVRAAPRRLRAAARRCSEALVGFVLATPLAAAAVAVAAAAPPPRLLSAAHEDGGCVWAALGADFAPEPLTKLPHPCAGASVAAAQGGKLAVVRFPAEAAEGRIGVPGYPKPAFPPGKTKPAQAELWRVPLGKDAGAPAKVPLPPDGALSRAGFDADGRLVALTLVELGNVTVKKDVNDAGEPVERFTAGGATYVVPAGGEGLKAVAYAYRWGQAGAWERYEDKPTTFGWDYALGADALDAAKLWQRPDEAGGDWQTGEVEPKSGAALLAAVKAWAPAPAAGGNDGWTRHTSSGRGRGEVLVWQVTGEFARDTGLILYKAPEEPAFKPLPGLGYTAGDLTSVSFAGDLMLVTTAGLRAHPRVFDLRTGKLVYASDKDFSVTFWADVAM